MRVEVSKAEWEMPGAQAMIDEGAMSDLAQYRAWVDGRRYGVIVSRDNIGIPRDASPDWRWHVSISGEDDVPRWGHLVALAHELRPGVVFVIGVPPRSWWMNVHPHTLHLFEVRDENLTQQWKAERMRSVPT